jgi:methylenetetrahydrofolate dehydrogenase (NADP+)/methenyltetrahydrofolate cyclohydrolase
MVKIIDGKKIAEKIKDEIIAEVLLYNNNDASAARRPTLAIILVGERPDSVLYVSLKEKEAKKVGIDTNLYKISAFAPRSDLEDVIKFLNIDENTDGILLQLPLPDGFDTDKIITLMDPAKDVDRFHPENLKKLGKDEILPPLCQVVSEVFEDANYDPEGKSACVVVNSEILGDSLSKMLSSLGALTRVVYHKDEDLIESCSKADILITAIGVPSLIKNEHVKKDALIIDIGITKKDDGCIVGDVDFESVKDSAGYLTPVPGGVGPITIAVALKNVLEIWKRKNNLK